MLSIQILEHTYAPGMEIPIPELPSLGRHIYHRCVSLYAEHTIIGPHLWPTYGDSYTRIALVGSTYISQMRQSLCWAYNYADPVYGVATICHQVRCLRWGHPRLFDTATSLLIWYKMFCMRDISYRPTWMKFINMLSVYTQSGTHRRVNWWIIAVLT